MRTGEIEIKKIISDLEQLEYNLKRIARDMKPIVFSRTVGLNPKDTLGWLNGKKNFSFEKLLKIANKLEV